MDSRSDFKYATINTTWGYVTVPLKKELSVLENMNEFVEWCQGEMKTAQKKDQKARFERRLNLARATILTMEENRGNSGKENTVPVKE